MSQPIRRRPVGIVPALCFLALGMSGVRADETLGRGGPTRQWDPLPAGAVARLGTLRFRAGSPIVLVSYLAGGKQVLTVSQDSSAAVWDAATGEVVRQLDLGEANKAAEGVGGVRLGRVELSATGGQVACSRDGKTLAILNRLQGTMTFWDVASGKVLARTERQPRAPSRLAVSADGSRVAATTYDQQITVYETATGRQVAQFSGMPAGEAVRMSPYKLEFGPDGKTLAQAGISFVQGIKAGLMVWEVATGKELRRWKDVPVDQSSLSVMGAAFSPDHKLVALPGRTAVSLVDLGTGQEVRKLEADGGVRLPAVAFSGDGKHLVAMGVRGEWLRVWEAATGKVVKEFGGGAGKAAAGLAAAAAVTRAQVGVVLSPDDTALAWGDGPVLRQMDLATGRDRAGPGGHAGAVLAAAFSRDGRSLTTVGEGGPVQRWDAATGKVQGPPAFGGKYTLLSLVSGDGSRAAALLPDGTWRVEEVGTGQELATIKGDGAAMLFAAALSADGRQLAWLNPVGGVVKVYDATTGQETKSIAMPTARANAAGAGVIITSATPRRVSFSPNGQYLLLEGIQGLSVWHVGEGREHRPVALPEGSQVRQAAFTPDSRALAVETANGQVLLVELATGRPRLTLAAVGAAGGMSSSALILASRGQSGGPPLSVSPDGRWLAQGRDDGRVRMWNLGSGKVEAELAGHRGGVGTVAFDAAGRQLVSGSGDTTALVWDARVFAKGPPAAQALEASAAEKAWVDLADSDASRAFQAVQALRGDPKSAAFLRERLKPAAGADEGKISKLVVELDSDMFAVRDRASRELEALGEAAVPSLRKVLRGEASAEVVRRVEELLAKTTTASLGGEQLRTLRAVEVLERLGTAEAMEALRAVANGAAGALSTVQAQEALERLGQPPVKRAGS